MQQLICTLSCFFVLTHIALSQPFEANLLYNWNDPAIPGTSAYDNAYNEIWGVVSNDREIAIIGSTLGTHFHDVTDPLNAEELESAFVPGAAQGTSIIHRDFHDYAGYLYAVSDEGASSLQIIDLSMLPDTTQVVYDSNQLIRQAHNIFIDTATARLYACGGNAPGSSFFLRILSLDDPAAPALLASYPNPNLNIPYVHDAYIQNDTAYLNCGSSGLYIVDFADPTAPVTLGVLEDYPQAGYNHSGWLDEGGRYYYMGDETHGRDLKVLDLQDLSDIQTINFFNAESSETYTIPHNLLVRDDLLYVSYYYDGLQVYDISDPANPVRRWYYDTFEAPSQNSYEGAWGVYPFLPSGNVLLSDMQTGLYVFEKMELTSNTSSRSSADLFSFHVYPQPAATEITLSATLPLTDQSIEVWIVDLQGSVAFRKEISAPGLQKWTHTLSLPATLPNGFFFLNLRMDGYSGSQKLLIQR